MAAGAVIVPRLGHVPVLAAVWNVAVRAESRIVIEPGRVDLGEAEGRPGRLGDPPGAAGADGGRRSRSWRQCPETADTTVPARVAAGHCRARCRQCSHPAGTCPGATSSMRTGRVIAVPGWREGQIPGSGETSPNPVLCAMPTQPGPHLGRRRAARTRSGQDRMVRPGREAAGTGPQRPVRWSAPDRATQAPVRGARRVDRSSGHAGHHPSVVASGCGSPVSAASAAATSARLART